MHKFTLAAMPLLATGLLAQGLHEAPEPNDTIATAAVLPLGEQAYGDITAGDEDWFKITLASDGDYKIWTGPGFAGQIEDTRVRILAADGTTLLIDVDDGNTATHGYYTTFQGALAAGDYFIGVRGYSASTVGSYTLDVVLATTGTYVAVAPPLTPAVEGAENNDPRPAYGSGAATPAAFFTRFLGDIAAGGTSGSSYTKVGSDYDFYALNVATPGSYVFRTTATPSAPGTPVDDTVLHLADSTLTRIAVNDDFGGTPYSQITFNIVTPGVYYVAVSGYYGTSAGSYHLDILGLTPPLPTGVSSVTVQPGGCPGTLGLPLLTARATTGSQSGRVPEVPVLGSSFYVDGVNLPPTSLVLRVVGLVQLPTPFSLALFGAPGCLIEVNPIDTIPSLSDAAGVHFWGLRSPANSVFIGLPLQQQLIVFDAGANGFNLITSNRVSSVFGVTH